MKRRWTLAFLAATGLAGAVAAAAAQTIVLFPLQRSTRDAGEAAAVVEQALYHGLRELGAVADPGETRNALRRLRLRSPERAGTDQLRRLGGELGATWIFSAALHDAPLGNVPDLSISGRLYDGASGELIWAGFAAASGLDSRTVLGLGVRDRVEALAPVPIRRLLAASPLTASFDHAVRNATPAPPMALVPFTAYVEADALAAAVTATEATRAALYPGVARLASPECVEGALRAQQSRAWGELSAAARSAIRAACRVDLLVTGSVERWEIGGPELEPRPVVALALRLLDAASGRILWMGSREATGWDNQGLFGLGRVYSRGALLETLLSRLSRDLLRTAKELSPPPAEPVQVAQAVVTTPVRPDAAPLPTAAPPTAPEPTPAPESPAEVAPEPTPAPEPPAETAPEPEPQLEAAPEPLDQLAQEPTPAVAEDSATAADLVESARAWLDRGVRYDPSYVEMTYPGGDPPADRGTAVDLLVRAFRGIGVDLQQAIHEEILRHRTAYGYDGREPDTNVSHRRIRNLVVFLARNAQAVAADDYRGGDVVVWDTDGNGRADHVGIVSSGHTAGGGPLVIHHRRPGGEFTGEPGEDDVLGRWPIAAHFRVETSPQRLAEVDADRPAGAQAPAAAPAAVEPPVEPEPTATPVEAASEPEPAAAPPPARAALDLAEAARSWLGRGVRYDASYLEMDYPGGDPPADRGAAVDLVVRAFRGVGIDLQQAVHEDIVHDPAAYGYGDRQPDTNISHRRIPNLLVFFARRYQRVSGDNYRHGDVVLWDTDADGRADHIGIVSTDATSGRLLVVHQRRPDAEFTGEPSEDDVLRRWPIAAHFRVDAAPRAATETVPGSEERPAAASSATAKGKEILAVVNSWAHSWSQQRVADYLAHYSREFRPATGLSRRAPDSTAVHRGRALRRGGAARRGRRCRCRRVRPAVPIEQLCRRCPQAARDGARGWRLADPARAGDRPVIGHDYTSSSSRSAERPSR